MRTKITLFLALIFLASTSIAGSAPWYKWKSKLSDNDKVFCLQTSPGDGWERVGGPYKDSRCEVPLESSSLIEKPSASDVMSFSNAVANSSSTDVKLAQEALQKWMDGELTVEESEKYKSELMLSSTTVENSSNLLEMQIMGGSTEQCMLCMAGCCFWWGCNPACIAGCVAGVCK